MNYTIGISLGLTVEVEGQHKNWIKPGVTASTEFGGMPTTEQVLQAFDIMGHDMNSQLGEEINIFLKTIQNAKGR